MDLSSVKLAIATPTRGNVHVDFMGSCFALIAACVRNRIQVGFLSSKQRTCPEARTAIVHEFLTQSDATHLLFVDSDIEFQSKTVLEMLALDLPVVGCAYPCRETAIGTYNINVEVLADSEQMPTPTMCLKVSAMGLGFTLIKRAALEEMVRYYADQLTYVMPLKGGTEFKAMVALFHEPIRDGNWFGEDFIFFYRWRELGPRHDVWLYLNAPLTHHVTNAKQLNAKDRVGEILEWGRAKGDYWPHGKTPVPTDAWHPEIIGWSQDILPWYRRIVEGLPYYAQCVEIGVYKGRSLLFLASELKRQGKVRAYVWGIDPGEEFSDNEGKTVEFASRAELLKHVERLKPEYSPEVIVNARPLTSLSAADEFGNKTLDLVFIDGAHDEASVRLDIETWRPKLKPGGILAGHDYSPAFPGVMAAVDALVPNRTIEASVWWTRV